MRNSAKIESVIVGIFDNAQDLERADERLAAAERIGMIYQSRPSKLGHEGTSLIPASWNTKKVLASA